MSGRAANSATVLVVDDDPQIRRALRAGLTAAGYSVLLAVKGQEALDQVALAQPPVDVVLLDLGLPDIDGLDVVRLLREWSRVPVVVVSARDEERMRIDALDLGADDYLTKPFSMGELLARLRVALRHAAAAQQTDSAERAAARFVDGGLIVDYAAHVVTLEGQDVHLTPTEFSLLQVLVTNAGRVLTHALLLGRVWGPHAVDDSGYLRTYVNQLRRKLEADSARPTRIITEPGIGYRYRRQDSDADA